MLQVASRVRSRSTPNYVYFARHGGSLYASASIDTYGCSPHAAAVYIAVCRQSFTVRLGKAADIVRSEQAAVTSATWRSLSGTGVQLLVAHVSPLHPTYRALRAIPEPGLLTLDRARFDSLDETMQEAARGALSPFDASLLYDSILELVGPALPTVKLADARVASWVGELRRNPHLSLQAMARQSGLSYQHMSRILAEALGLPLRQFQLWQKLCRVRSVYRDHDSLTAIAHAAGFSDLAHMTRSFQRNYGTPPSHFFRNPNAHVIDTALPGSRYAPLASGLVAAAYAGVGAR